MQRKRRQVDYSQIVGIDQEDQHATTTTTTTTPATTTRTLSLVEGSGRTSTLRVDVDGTVEGLMKVVWRATGTPKKYQELHVGGRVIGPLNRRLEQQRQLALRLGAI